MRSFIAIDFTEQIKIRIAGAQTQLEKAETDVKWVSRHQLHLTLWFFKDLSLEKTLSISERIKEEAQNNETFEITLKGIGCFPHSGSPRVIWVGIQNSRNLSALQIKIHEVASLYGEDPVKSGQNDYFPHVTIGRVRSGKNIKQLKNLIKLLSDVPFGACPVRELIFFESRLNQIESNYFEFQRFPLKPKI
ncbi:MAG: RNA 2',3'-cyclic phosphodiesterase [Nitrospiria bacterium]